MGTTFTVISSESCDDEWPEGWDKTTSMVEGDLADRIRAKVGVYEHTPVIIVEEQTDGGWSEYTQETDYEFELRVGNETVQLPSRYPYTAVGMLSLWLDGDA